VKKVQESAVYFYLYFIQLSIAKLMYWQYYILLFIWET